MERLIGDERDRELVRSICELMNEQDVSFTDGIAVMLWMITGIVRSHGNTKEKMLQMVSRVWDKFEESERRSQMQ